MSDLGRVLMAVGAGVAVLGAALWALGRAGFKGLPGDLRWEGERVRVYFPLVSCLALSLLATGLMWLWRWMQKK
jgi:hypothetical protein